MASIEQKTILVNGAEGTIGSLLMDQLRETGAVVLSVNASVAEPALATALGMSALLDRLQGRPIDILVNLAALSCCRLARKDIPAQAEAYRAGLITSAMISRALLPQMKALNDGHIVSVGAPFDDRPTAGFEIWSSENAGHKGLTKALLSESGGSCVRISYVDVLADVNDDDYIADRIFAAITDFDWRRNRTAAAENLSASWALSASAMPAGIGPLPTPPVTHAPDAPHPRHYR
jgi:NADP-dependent 3-hydroxy acid dehydrogenase YdfG